MGGKKRKRNDGTSDDGGEVPRTKATINKELEAQRQRLLTTLRKTEEKHRSQTFSSTSLT
jgi:hypothetical protein